MQDIYLVNYCSPGCPPLYSITRLSKQKAFALAKELATENKGASFGRFADFENYYPRRIRTEKWLYDCFISLGGKPVTKHPLYFVLHGSDYLNEWFDKGKITKICLNNIDSKHISFTFGDSMAKMNKPERKDPFLKETLFELINKYNGDVSIFLDSIKEQYTYIEAQIWNDVYCSRHLF